VRLDQEQACVPAQPVLELDAVGDGREAGHPPPPQMFKQNSSPPRPGLSQERERRGLVFRPPDCYGSWQPSPHPRAHGQKAQNSYTRA